MTTTSSQYLQSLSDWLHIWSHRDVTNGDSHPKHFYVTRRTGLHKTNGTPLLKLRNSDYFMLTFTLSYERTAHKRKALWAKTIEPLGLSFKHRPSNVRPEPIISISWLLPIRKRTALKLKSHFWADTHLFWSGLSFTFCDQRFNRILKAITGWHVWTLFTSKSPD